MANTNLVFLQDKQRVRNVTVVAYPLNADGTPKQDWNENFQKDLNKVCEKEKLKGFISPLHDKDVIVNEQGERVPKLPHYHVVLSANGPKSGKTFRTILEEVFGKDNIASKIQKVMNVEAMLTYVTHDTKAARRDKKHQYSQEDITFLNNATKEDFQKTNKKLQYQISDEDKTFKTAKAKTSHMIGLFELIRKFKAYNLNSLAEIIENLTPEEQVIYQIGSKADFYTLINLNGFVVSKFLDANYQDLMREEVDEEKLGSAEERHRLALQDEKYIDFVEDIYAKLAKPKADNVVQMKSEEPEKQEEKKVREND